VIQSLKLKNFRNFKEWEFFFEKDYNFILGENGAWKSNILEAIALLSGNELFWLDFPSLVNKKEDIFFIEALDFNHNKIAISYDKRTNTKHIFLNGKKTTIQKQKDFVNKGIVFHPMVMNMMYLSPSLRRDFLDNTLSLSFKEYAEFLKKYKEILRKRNIFLKSIREGKSKKEDIAFWNKNFIEKALVIYSFRKRLINFFQENITSLLPYFDGKVENIEFVSLSKTDKNNLETSIKNYLEKNLERDIILGNTQIGPHVDDFTLMLDTTPITYFASRWEAKSTIIGLKLLESRFIEEQTGKKPIILIDDLLSEIDEKHKNMILKRLTGYQIIITSLWDAQFWNVIKI